MTTMPPGDPPGIGAVGTAANPVRLSGEIAMLSVRPGMLMGFVVLIASDWLFTTAIVFAAALKANVNFRLFDTTICRGVLPVPVLITDTGARTSLLASTMISPAVVVELLTSCETSARNFKPLVPALLLELELPQERTKLMGIRMKTRSTALFKRGTPKSVMNKDLNANQGL
jgi:hypothetical protein